MDWTVAEAWLAQAWEWVLRMEWGAIVVGVTLSALLSLPVIRWLGTKVRWVGRWVWRPVRASLRMAWRPFAWAFGLPGRLWLAMGAEPARDGIIVRTGSRAATGIRQLRDGAAREMRREMGSAVDKMFLEAPRAFRGLNVHYTDLRDAPCNRPRFLRLIGGIGVGSMGCKMEGAPSPEGPWTMIDEIHPSQMGVSTSGSPGQVYSDGWTCETVELRPADYFPEKHGETYRDPDYEVVDYDDSGACDDCGMEPAYCECDDEESYYTTRWVPDEDYCPHGGDSSITCSLCEAEAERIVRDMTPSTMLKPLGPIKDDLVSDPRLRTYKGKLIRDMTNEEIEGATGGREPAQSQLRELRTIERRNSNV